MRSLVNKAFYQIKETGKIRLFKSHRPDYKDGEQVRDFVYIKDTIEIMSYLLKNHSVHGIFNLGSGISRTWNDLASAIFSAMNLPLKIEYIDMPESLRDAYQYRTLADMNKLKNTGVQLMFDTLENSVKDYVANYLSKSEFY